MALSLQQQSVWLSQHAQFAMKLKHALVKIRTDDALKNIYSNAVPAANGNDISQSSYTETLSRPRKPVL